MDVARSRRAAGDVASVGGGVCYLKLSVTAGKAYEASACTAEWGKAEATAEQGMGRILRRHTEARATDLEDQSCRVARAGRRHPELPAARQRPEHLAHLARHADREIL
jgi:hypothetical protein